MRFVALLPALLICSCNYMGQRLADTIDMFRFEGSFGIGIQADAKAGELAHGGGGSSRVWVGGLHYGRIDGRFIEEDYLPLSYYYALEQFISSNRPGNYFIHRRLIEGRPEIDHHCYMILPREINRDERVKSVIHYLDVEASAHAGILGAKVGFSAGEAIDWVLGWFKMSDEWKILDPAQDDLPNQRANRRFHTERIESILHGVRP